MAIGTGDAIEKFGTQIAVTNAGIAINDGGMSTQANAIAWTNSDDAPEADFVFEGIFSAAPTTSHTVSIYARKLNVRLTNDENQPVIATNEDILIGAFNLDASQVNQVKTARCILPNGRASQEYEFYFKNNGGENITGAQFWITPITTGPAA